MQGKEREMKKTMKKLLPLFLAVVMSLAFAGAALAENGTITINPPASVDTSATNTYNIYKVFDAVGDGTNISYKLCDGDTLSGDMATYFEVDSAGNISAKTGAQNESGELTPDAIAAIATFVAGKVPVDSPTASGSVAAVSKTLPNGYYYITTSTGTVVTIDSTNPNVTVNDKNTVPSLDKKITGEIVFDEDGKKAIQAVGGEVPYQAEITIGKGFKNYKYVDTMTNQVLKDNSIAVEGMTQDTDYTVSVNDDKMGFTITFLDTGAIKNKAVNDKIKIAYTGIITSAALTVDKAENTANVTYGDEGAGNKTPDSTTEVYNAEIDVNKKDGSNNNAPLANAGFKLKNSEGQFYKYTAATETAPEKVEWVAENEATEYLTKSDGKLATKFVGLAAGNYTLVESTVPAGYNKAADTPVSISKTDVQADTASLSKTVDVTNNKGAVLPSTGGIGTTIFYIAGSALVLVAGAALFARRVARKQS